MYDVGNCVSVSKICPPSFSVLAPGGSYSPAHRAHGDVEPRRAEIVQDLTGFRVHEVAVLVQDEVFQRVGDVVRDPRVDVVVVVPGRASRRRSRALASPTIDETPDRSRRRRRRGARPARNGGEQSRGHDATARRDEVTKNGRIKQETWLARVRGGGGGDGRARELERRRERRTRRA